ncbi:MAG: DNA polymerase III subunit delta' [Kordiimonas sp.]|nr:DNA polymerase III subunit delta' [Kordiimonas sp.]
MATEHDDKGIPHPRETTILRGHEAAQKDFLDAYNSERLHHGWLICGPKGTGKSTLAYHIARFLLKNPPEQNEDSGLFGEALAKTPVESLHVDLDDPVCQRILSGGHGDLITVERSEGDNGKLRNDIVIGDVRRVAKFFANTSAEGGWRVAIIDSADEMNRNAANALLKILEEPPQNTILLLLAHAPARLLPTIVSRCRRINLKPLSTSDVVNILSELHPDLDDNQKYGYAVLCEGSPGQAITLSFHQGLELFQQILTLLSKLPDLDTVTCHRFAEELASRQQSARYELFCDLLGRFLNRMIRHASFIQQGQVSPVATIMDGEGELMLQLATAMPLDRWVQVWEKVNQLFAQTDGLHLDRKQIILNVFDLLARSVRAT